MHGKEQGKYDGSVTVSIFAAHLFMDTAKELHSEIFNSLSLQLRALKLICTAKTQLMLARTDERFRYTI